MIAPARALAGAHAAYLLATGIWPLLHRESFERVVGPKEDFWLARTVGGLAAATGAPLGLAAHSGRRRPETVVLALGSGAVFGAADVRAARTESKLYLGDSVASEDVLAGRTTPLELAALVGAAGLVLCGDTGVAHLATAFGTPSVVLFGPVSPAEWGPPPGDPLNRALWAGHTGDPHARETDPGLLRLTAEEVCAEIDELRAHVALAYPADEAFVKQSAHGVLRPMSAGNRSAANV